MVARPTYLAPRYREVSLSSYARYSSTVMRSGQIDRLDMLLPLALTDGLAFLAGTAGDVPGVGDEIGVGATGRLDIFTVGTRCIVLAES